MNPFNPFSGFGAAGLRFKVRIRAISHQNLYLPVKMRQLPQLRSLIDGVSPLKVFSCSSIIDARKAFYELRKKYDFPFWALLDFKVPNPVSNRMLVPLRLNRFQNYLAHVFSLGRVSRDMYGYIVSKTIPKCGLTTCVQAYITWLQNYWLPDNSITVLPFGQEGAWRDIVAAFFRNGRTLTSTSVDELGHDAHFWTYLICHSNLDVDFSGSYLHIADLSRFNDRNMYDTKDLIEYLQMYFLNTIIRFSTNRVSLFVVEGDRPADTLQSLNVPNPYFLRQVIEADKPNSISCFRHIDLDAAPYRIFPPTRNP